MALIGRPASSARTPLRRGLAAAGLVLVVLLALWGGYTWGQRNPHVSVLTGEAYFSGYQADVQVNGWTYNVPLDVSWLGAGGAWNDHGRPACLRVGRHPLTFGEVPVNLGGTSWRQVVWVSCAG